MIRIGYTEDGQHGLVMVLIMDEIRRLQSAVPIIFAVADVGLPLSAVVALIYRRPDGEMAVPDEPIAELTDENLVLLILSDEDIQQGRTSHVYGKHPDLNLEFKWCVVESIDDEKQILQEMRKRAGVGVEIQVIGYSPSELPPMEN